MTPGSNVGSATPAGPQGLRTTSLRRRVTVTVWLLLAAMVVVLALATGLALTARLDSQLRQRLVDRTAIAAALVGQSSAQSLVDRLEGDGVSVILTTTDGRRLAKGPLATTSGVDPAPGTGRPVPDPGPGPAGPAAGAVVQQGDLYRVDRTLSDGSRLVLIASAADVRRTTAQVELILAAGAVLVLALATVILGPLIRRALRPLAEMTATARSITAGDRGRRLRPTRPETELGSTATAFDEMLDAVEGAEAQARRAEQRLRTFLSDAAHELRTPLAGARAGAEQVLRADLSRTEREQLLAATIRETERAGRLVDDMLTMSRIDQGLQLRRSRVDLRDLAARAAGDRTLTAPEAQLAVDGPTVGVIGDPDRIVQIVSNLLDNALRASGDRGRVQLETSVDGAMAQLRITDDGPGVAAADSERIFDRLVRLDPSRGHVDRSGGHEGFGLGLPIARGLARAHGGDLICLPPRPDAGATFLLTLPLRPPGTIGGADRFSD